MIERNPIKRKTDELLSPSNQEAYKKILNTPLSKEQSDYIENSYKFHRYLKENNKED